MTIETIIEKMPKIELHVHMEGSIRPETLLKLARRNEVTLPASNLDGLREWYHFVDFPHLIQVYKTIGTCLRTVEDIELIAREFLQGQYEQNILYTEATYTPYVQYKVNKISFKDQIAAINRARKWAEDTLGVKMNLTIDISREVPEEDGMLTADWAIEGMAYGVTGLGLGGPEAGNPPEKFKRAFERALQAGLHSIPHAGEVAGPESIWGALRALKAERIGHGVRCLEDPILVEELRQRQIPLEVAPTSNVCLKVASSFADHPLPRLIKAGLYVTLNSDDPPMFNTTLTDEYLQVVEVFGFSIAQCQTLVMNALEASFLAADEKNQLRDKITTEFAIL